MRTRWMAHWGWVAGLALACLAPAAQAQGRVVEVFAERTVDVKAGPDWDYPTVATVRAGSRMDLYGCIDSYGTERWCDVQLGYDRGWVEGRDLQASYRGRRVIVGNEYSWLALPTLTFYFENYWGSYYSGRPWYRERSRWYGHDVWWHEHRNRPRHSRPDWRPYHDRWNGRDHRDGRWDGRGRDNDRRDNDRNRWDNDRRDRNNDRDRRDNDRNRWDGNGRDGRGPGPGRGERADGPGWNNQHQPGSPGRHEPGQPNRGPGNDRGGRGNQERVEGSRQPGNDVRRVGNPQVPRVTPAPAYTPRQPNQIPTNQVPRFNPRENPGRGNGAEAPAHRGAPGTAQGRGEGRGNRGENPARQEARRQGRQER